MKVPLDSIERDEGLQMRVKISREVVRDYVDKLRRGEQLPPIKLFVDERGRYWPGDGWHRLLAHESLALPEIESDVQNGGRRAAFIAALGANNEHGLRRSRADIQKTVRCALEDAEIRQKSDREIGKLVGVDHKTVGKVRRMMGRAELLDAFRVGADRKVRRVPASSRVGKSPVADFSRVDSAPGGAGALPDFNVVARMHELESGLTEQFKDWPAEKRHAFCVALSNFAKENDPEIRQMKQDAFDEVLQRKDEACG